MPEFQKDPAVRRETSKRNDPTILNGFFDEQPILLYALSESATTNKLCFTPTDIALNDTPYHRNVIRYTTWF